MSSATYLMEQTMKVLTLSILPGDFRPKHKGAKIFENLLYPVMLVFIG